jgi:hypothetical protein
MSDELQFYLTCFAIQLVIGYLTLMAAILAAHYWTGSGSFPLVRTLVVTALITLVFALPSSWGWPTFFSHPISVAAFFYLPFWLAAIWFGYRLDPKEAWTIITIHWPLMVGIALFVYFPIYSSMERELERKLRAKERMSLVPLSPGGRGVRGEGA